MAVNNIAKAAAYSDRYLKRVGENREWLRRFWSEHTPEGKHAARKGLWGSGVGDLVGAMPGAFVAVIINVQSFVYSDEGDALLGLPEAPATDAEMDGLLGPGTYRRMLAWLDHVQPDEPIVIGQPGTDWLVFAGDRVAVPNTRIRSFDEPDSLDLPAAAVKRYGKLRGFTKWHRPVPELIDGADKRYARLLGSVHWDVCGSAKGCFRALLAQGYGSIGGIDNDGTLFQWADPGVVRGWHAGNVANRAACTSWDMSNKVSLKYAARYADKVGIARPVLHLDRKGRLGRGNGFLGMYAAQITTLLRVLEALARHLGLPHEWPLLADGTPRGANWAGLWRSGWRGVASHHHLPKTTKWDVRGFERQVEVLLHARPALASEFPQLVAQFNLDSAASAQRVADFKATCRWPELGIGG